MRVLGKVNVTRCSKLNYEIAGAAAAVAAGSSNSLAQDDSGAICEAEFHKVAIAPCMQYISLFLLLFSFRSGLLRSCRIREIRNRDTQINIRRLVVVNLRGLFNSNRDSFFFFL